MISFALLAEASETVQIVQAILTAIGTMFAAWIGYLTLKVRSGQAAAAVKVEEVAVKQDAAAVKVEQVAATLDQHTANTSEQIAALGGKVDDVHQATNGLTEKLVNEVRRAATLQGAADEHARAKADKTNGS